MAELHVELLEVAQFLLSRSRGERGRLPRARVRRSISTAYYALFHFLLDEMTRNLVGEKAVHAKRRHILGRTFQHIALRETLKKISATSGSSDYAAFFRSGSTSVSATVPQFIVYFAGAFKDAQTKRHDADYDLLKSLGEKDARLVIARVEDAIVEWRAADRAKDRDAKRMISILLLLQGKLRKQD